MIKLGRVCLYIKEWSLDNKRFNHQEKLKLNEKNKKKKQFEATRETSITKFTTETLDNILDGTNMSINNLSVESMQKLDQMSSVRQYDQMSALELASYH